MLTTHHQKTANHKDHLKESKNTLCIFQRCPLLSECQSPGSFNLAAASQSGRENYLTLICLGLFNYHSPHWRNCALQNPEHNREPATLQVTGEPSFFGFSLLEASGSNCSSWLWACLTLPATFLHRPPNSTISSSWHIPSQVGRLVFLYVLYATQKPIFVISIEGRLKGESCVTMLFPEPSLMPSNT